MAPSAVLAQEETTLPEVRVIATTPAPAGPRRPARTAPAPTRGTQQTPAQTAAPPAPSEPGVIDRDKFPSTTQTLTPQDFDPSKSVSVPDALMRVVPSVSIGDTAVNPFQPDVQYRGFLASPTVGAPQGLAIYQNGVRINEAFGDTVNWDFIPERAIRRLDVVPSNPIFGLNAIGGAISIEMKNGFNYTGREIEGIVGSFGRRAVGAQFGAQKDNVAFYAAVDALNDNGWRQRSNSELRRIYTDVGVRGDDTEFHLNFTGASNRFGALASTPIELLNRSWSSVYTSPQTYQNQLAFLNATGSYRVSDTWTVKGNAYIRSFRQQHVDGNTSDVTPCDPGTFPGFLCFGDDTTLLFGQNGNPVPDILGGAVPGSIDRTLTNAVTVGGTVQAASSDKLFGRDNQFVVGASLDHGNVRFNASSELGTINNDLFVTGTGVIIAQPDGAVAPVDLKTRNTYYGFYATDTIDLTSRLSVTAGGRFNLAQIRLEDQLGVDLNGSHQFSRFNPVIGATYKLTPNATVYAGYSEANRAPTPAELACSDPTRPCLLDNFLVADPALKQVVSRTYEAGLRGQFAPGKNDRFSWSFGVFTTDSSDDIIRVASPIAGRGFFQNAGTTRRQGIEASANYRVERWSVFATYSLVDATFQNTLTLLSPFNPLADANQEITVVPGNRLPGVPRHRFKAGVDYAVQDGWTVGADLVAVSGQFLAGDESNLNPMLPGYWVANLHSTYRVSKEVELFGQVRNVFDKRYYTSGTFFETDAIPFLGLSDPRTVSPGAPRAFYAGLRGKF
jgi:iron complex outermembrane receptor protein